MRVTRYINRRERPPGPALDGGSIDEQLSRPRYGRLRDRFGEETSRWWHLSDTRARYLRSTSAVYGTVQV